MVVNTSANAKPVALSRETLVGRSVTNNTVGRAPIVCNRPGRLKHVTLVTQQTIDRCQQYGQDPPALEMRT